MLTFETDGGACRDGGSARLASSVLEVQLVAAELRVRHARYWAVGIVVGSFTDVLPVLQVNYMSVTVSLSGKQGWITHSRHGAWFSGVTKGEYSLGVILNEKSFNVLPTIKSGNVSEYDEVRHLQLTAGSEGLTVSSDEWGSDHSEYSEEGFHGNRVRLVDGSVETAGVKEDDWKARPFILFTKEDIP